MMLRSILLTAVLLSGCAKVYLYDLPDRGSISIISEDSLKWKYVNGSVVSLPVLGRDGNIRWLEVGPKTILVVNTVEGEQFRFYLPSIEVQDGGEGLLGSGVAWRGYDARQGAKRTVLLRDVRSTEIISPIPAGVRIAPK